MAKLQYPTLAQRRQLEKEFNACRSATVSKNAAGQWFISLQCDCIDVINPPATDKTLGLDLGLSSLVAMSDGGKEKPKRFLKQSLHRLAHAQRD